MKKISLHRALTELKILDSRIEKAIREIIPIGYLQKDKLVNNLYTKENFTKKAEAALQSANALIELKNNIKAAVIKANAITIIEVAGKKMTIADAITYKTNIGLKKSLLNRLRQEQARITNHIEQRNRNVEDSAFALAESALGKDNVKIGEKDTEAIMSPFIKSQEYTLIDPLKIEELILNLDEEIVSFETEIDATLSEINATTLIEVNM